MRLFIQYIVLLAVTAGMFSCAGSGNREEDTATDGEKKEMVTKRRDDGTISSVNPLDDEGYIHGVKVNFYEDGRTVHSRVTYLHGRKHGPAIWYYKSGQVYEHTNFHHGRKNGLTKRYYENGQLMEEVTYELGEETGKKQYNKKGELTSGG